MVSAVYPGGFDPVTNGHVDIIQRASALFDEVVVAVFNRGRDVFTLEERVAMLETETAKLPNVRVDAFEGLVVHYAQRIGATVLVRAMRVVTDFESEFDMALMNKKMAPGLESVFLMASLNHLFISASRIREIASLGHPVNDLVPAFVAATLEAKYGPPRRM